MNDEEIKLPFYAKATFFFIGLFAFFTILYIGQNIIVPLIFATIIAIVLHPVVNFFVRIGINRIVAIVITIFLTFLVIAAFGLLIISQFNRLSESWPELTAKFTETINDGITWLSGYLDIRPKEIHEWVSKTQNELFNTSTDALKQTIVNVGNGLIIIFLIPVYVFLVLFYQPILLEFIHRSFGADNKSQVSEIVSKTKSVIQRYLVGLVIEATIVATLNTTALVILGIEYALILGVLGALLNIIPYIGGLVAVALPMAVALVTKSTPVYALYVLALYYFIQLIDNNYIVPYIVASKVKINALFSIIVVLAGNALWGVPGMFLSIPLLAIVKLICDHIEPLNHWGFLLGDTMPPILTIKTIFKKIKPKAK